MGQYTKRAIELHRTTITATAIITAGQPYAFDGTVAAADAHILGIATEDIASTDLGTNSAITSAIVAGEVTVTANGAIAAGDYVKVGAAGKFLTASAADLAAGKVVGTAKTASTGDGVDFVLMVGFIL
jgi:hypothetical protein